MKWYAVQVTTAHERKVQRQLEKRRINGLASVIGEIFVPFRDGKPLMPGYVFIQSKVWPDSFLPHGYSRCRTIGVITEEELSRFKHMAPAPSKYIHDFKKGDPVIITIGSLAGVQGFIQRPGLKRSKISYFNGEVTIDADNELLRPCKEAV